MIFVLITFFLESFSHFVIGEITLGTSVLNYAVCFKDQISDIPYGQMSIEPGIAPKHCVV